MAAAKARTSSSRKPTSSPSTPSWTVQLPRYLAFAILILFLFIRIGFRDIPIERDEGSYAYMGQLLVQGGTPYVDFYEMKPPALYTTYGVLSALSGGDISLMHVWMALFLTLAGMFLFYLVRRWLDDGAGLFAVLSYAVLAMTPFASGFSIQAEHWVAIFAIIGLWAMTRGLQQAIRWQILLGGFLLCWGLLVKQNGLFFAVLSILLVPAFHLAENRTQWVRNTLRDGGWLAAGAAIPLVLFGGQLLLQGTWADFWFWNVEYPQAYTSTISWERGQELLNNMVRLLTRDYLLFWVLGGSGALLVWLTSLSWYKKVAVTAFLVLAALSVTPGRRFYGHYFLHFIPALAVGAGATIYVLSTWLGKAIPAARTWLAPLAAVLIFLVTVADQEAYYFRPQFTKILREVYGSNPFPESRQLADFLAERYQPGDGLLVLGSEPQIYAYLEADCPTRHHFMGFLLKNHPQEKEWQDEVIREVQADPPRYAVWVQHPLSWLPAQGADQNILNWGWGLVRREYVPIAWYDQVVKGQVTVIEGEAARNYQAKGEQYMVLVERQTPAGGTNREGNP